MPTAIDLQFVKQVRIVAPCTSKNDVGLTYRFVNRVRVRFDFGMSDWRRRKNLVLPNRPGKPYRNAPVILRFKNELIHKRIPFDSAQMPKHGFMVHAPAIKATDKNSSKSYFGNTPLCSIAALYTKSQVVYFRRKMRTRNCCVPTSPQKRFCPPPARRERPKALGL